MYQRGYWAVLGVLVVMSIAVGVTILAQPVPAVPIAPAAPAKPTAKVVHAADFDVNLATLRVGMSKEQVEKAIGNPDFSRTYTEYSSLGNATTTWPAGAAEMWHYESKATVTFDSEAKVQLVWGERQGLMQPHTRP